MTFRALIAVAILLGSADAKTIRYRVGNLSGLRENSGQAIPQSIVARGLNQAIENVQKLANIKFVRDNNRPQVTFLVGRHSANGRGLFDGRRIWLNARMGGWTQDFNQMRVLLEHEIGHLLGLPHYGGSGRWIMSINVTTRAVWNPTDIAKLVRKLGNAKKPPTPDNTPANAALAKEMRGVSDALKKTKTYKRQQAVTIRASIVRLRQMQRDYGLPR